MGRLTYTVVAVAILSAIFLNYPAPPLSERVLGWKDRGKTFQFGNHSIFYIAEKGSRPDRGTVLIFHGFPTSSFDWIKIFEDLKAEFGQVVVYDMLGYGLSDKPKYHDYRIAEQADIGEALLHKLGVQETHVLSHDYGDTVALEVLARQGTGKLRMKSLCLSNGGIFPETNHPKRIQWLMLNPVLGPIISRLSTFQFFKRELKGVFGSDSQPTYEDITDFYSLTRQQDGNKVLPNLLQYIPERQKYKDRWVGALKGSRVPVHMIYGPDDPVNPSEFADFYRRNVPKPSITVLESGIGHYPQWESPVAFMESYRTFLASLKQ